MTRRLVPLAAVVVMGCTPQPPMAAPQPQPQSSPQPVAVGPCDAAALQGMIGRTADEALYAELLKRSGARSLRRLGPDSIATMDYRPDRLNVGFDAAGRVTRITCG